MDGIGNDNFRFGCTVTVLDNVGAARHKNAFCTPARCRSTAFMTVTVEHVSHHGHDFGVHLAYPEEDVGMEWVRPARLAPDGRHELGQLVTSIVHGSRDAPLAPLNGVD